MLTKVNSRRSDSAVLPEISPSPVDDEKKDSFNDVNVEKSLGSEDVHERELQEERDEYLVQDYAHDIAVKVLSTQDDPSEPAFTFRMLFLGFGLGSFGAVLAQIYYFKPQTVSVSHLFLLLISYFIGNFMAAVIPRHGWWRYLNPGPFNIKEHTAAIIMCSTAAVSATASEIVAVDTLFYGKTLNPAVAIFMLCSSQLLGYGFAGILRDFLVYPTACWWPNIVTTATVFQALHYERTLASKRVRMFWVAFGAIAVWEIVPQYIFPVLTGLSIFCLIDNGRSDVLRNVFGGASNNEGMGALAACLDWNYIGSGCLWTPLKTQVNQWIGFLFTYFFMALLYYCNVWKAKNFPFMSQALFYENGTVYDQTQILTDNVFDANKFATAGPAFFSASNAWFLLVSNLALGACLVHVLLWHWPEVKGAFTGMAFRKGNDVQDEHYEKMKVYKPVPHWWFVIVFVIAYGVAQATNYTSGSGLPWWTFTVLLILTFSLTVVYGYLASITGFYLSWFGTGFFQMLVAFILPGRPVANMFGTLYGQHTMNQALGLLSDFKLGQYCKLPPRVTFFAQISGAIVGSVLNYVMIVNNRPALLSIAGTRLWSGQNAQSFNSNAISWGALGPQMFGKGGTYVMVPIALAIGLVLPIPFWLAHRRWPKARFNWVITPYSAWLTVGINTSITFTVIIGFWSQYWLRNKHPRWFTKVRPVVSGCFLSCMLTSFAVFGAAGTAHDFPVWWGNPSLDQGLSADRCKAPA
ncbi:OPT superfamily oligopeptide transporter [Exidia glandulosa HHB12029]|uniref:OPT superfamily oligopeptide transporter n=1 Tax=Exidia glandulosa HHB12029 TaxID=1314781 RepID=A0A165NEQ8_EXIGL|nr:OPT superfamily oligopeptide transporter [Exidia glandulosa HHB12029]